MGPCLWHFCKNRDFDDTWLVLLLLKTLDRNFTVVSFLSAEICHFLLHTNHVSCLDVHHFDWLPRKLMGMPFCTFSRDTAHFFFTSDALPCSMWRKKKIGRASFKWILCFPSFPALFLALSVCFHQMLHQDCMSLKRLPGVAIQIALVSRKIGSKQKEGHSTKAGGFWWFMSFR